LKHYLRSALSPKTTTRLNQEYKGGNMKTESLLFCALLLCSLVMLNTSLTARVITPQDKNNKSKISADEAKAVKAVEAAPDVNAKFAAAEVFAKKYPKSNARQYVAQYIVDQILGVKEPDQKLALAQKFPAVFTEPAEVITIKPALIDAYVQLKRFDEAFADGGAHLAKNADDIQVLVILAIAGTEQAKARNAKYVKASSQYGAKAIELIEANKKAANMDDSVWARQKALLPQLYQEMGIISLVEGNATEAQAKLEKSLKLAPGDPFNYVLLGSLTNDEYQKAAQNYRNMPDGKGKDDTLQKASALLDKVIDQYAHAVALSEGKPQYQALHDQVLQDLSAYYSYRHNKSTDGLQKLIDSYKLP
jgi:hypothetical protein